MTRLPPDRVEAVRRLIAEGLSYGAIGRELGVSKGAIAGVLRRHLQAEWDARPRPEPKLPRAGRQPRKPRPPKLVAAPAPPPAYYLHCAGRGACEWPIGDSRPWRFCAQDRMPGSVYCATHHAIAYHRNLKTWAA